MYKIIQKFLGKKELTFEELLIKLNSKELCVRGFRISTYIGGNPTERMYQISYKSASTFAIDEQDYYTQHYFDIKDAMKEFIDWWEGSNPSFYHGSIYLYPGEAGRDFTDTYIKSKY